MATSISYKAKHQVVIKKGQDAAEAIGKKMGAYVMTTARQSIRKGKASQPGQPPRNKVGTLKRNIIFAYDPQSRSVLVGPRFLGDLSSREAPQALEKGGTSVVRTSKGRKRQRVAARPFMWPALEKRAPELAQLWHNAIR